MSSYFLFFLKMLLSDLLNLFEFIYEHLLKKQKDWYYFTFILGILLFKIVFYTIFIAYGNLCF